MAYPRPRGDDPLNFEEYDPTPFSGGYDQVALYGRPKSPSAETCYPASESAPHGGGSCGSGYGAETTPYVPGQGSGPKYGVDESRPSYQHDDPPHASDDFSSGYGRPKPDPSYGRPKPKPTFESDETCEGEGYGSGYGRPQPKPSSCGGGEGFGSGYGRPKPKPSSYEEEGEGFGSGYGRPKPKPSSYEEEGEGFGSGYERPAYEEEGDGYGRPKPGYGESGFGRPQAGFGEEGGDGRRPGYGGFVDTPRPPPPEEEDRFGGGRKPSRFESDEYGGEEEYGGRKKTSQYENEFSDRPSYGGEEPPRPPMEEGYGGYQGEEHQHGHGRHHHKHHWGRDDE